MIYLAAASSFFLSLLCILHCAAMHITETINSTFARWRASLLLIFLGLDIDIQVAEEENAYHHKVWLLSKTKKTWKKLFNFIDTCVVVKTNTAWSCSDLWYPMIPLVYNQSLNRSSRCCFKAPGWNVLLMTRITNCLWKIDIDTL